jgi:hypothetical protein
MRTAVAPDHAGSGKLFPQTSAYLAAGGMLVDAPPISKPGAIAVNPRTLMTLDLRLGAVDFDDANAGISTPVEMTVPRSAAGPAVMFSGARQIVV